MQIVCIEWTPCLPRKSRKWGLFLGVAQVELRPFGLRIAVTIHMRGDRYYAEMARASLPRPDNTPCKRAVLAFADERDSFWFSRAAAQAVLDRDPNAFAHVPPLGIEPRKLTEPTVPLSNWGAEIADA